MKNYNLENAIRFKPILTCFFVVLTSITFWIITRPYVGIIMDAQLYTFQAMAKIQPAKFSDDLYLKFGSQDHFTIYGYVLAGAISLMGIAAANFWMTVIGGIFWILAATFLAQNLFSKASDRIVAIWSVISLASGYAGGFSYAQQYQSPRLYVEAIVLISIAFAIQRAWWRACLSLVIGLLIHPLMILYGFGIVFVLATFERRYLWFLPISGCAVVVGLAWFGIDPFVRLTQVIAGNWWAVVAQISQNAFISDWTILDYATIMMQTNLLILAFWFGTEIERRLLKALAVVVSISLSTSFIGADTLHNLLLVNVQLGRVTWILGVFANLFTGVIFVRTLARKGNCKYYLIFCLALYVLQRFIPFEIFLTFLFLFLCSLALSWEERCGELARIFELPLFAVLCFFFALTVLLMFLMIKTQLASTNHSFWLLSFGLTLIAFFSIFLFFAGNRILGLGIISGAFLLGLSGFDQRSPWEKFIEKGEQPPASILTILSNSDHIYWENGLDYLWFDLKKPSYFSNSQGWGSMFYKATAAEYRRRGEVLYQLNTSDFGNAGNFPKLKENEIGPDSPKYLTNVCEALPELDLIVLFTRVPNAATVEWTAPAPQYIGEKTDNGEVSVMSFSNYYFYKCKDFRTNEINHHT